jgi:hypothetical protein
MERDHERDQKSRLRDHKAPLQERKSGGGEFHWSHWRPKWSRPFTDLRR